MNHIVPYFLDDAVRDLVLILPGGGYAYCSPREAKPVADVFLKEGYHAAVYEYRQEILPYPALYDEALRRIETFKADPRIDRLFVCGFSAGGHFAGLLLTGKPEWFAGGILAYPVVTADVMTRHDFSIRQLVGDQPTNEDLDKVSIEKRVTKDTPPLFLWSTVEDKTVPVENSLVLFQALRKHGVKAEMHLYQDGPHGLALCDRTTPWDQGDPLEYERLYKHPATWMSLAIAWLEQFH
jgi:acetyl esterase/lipase